MKRTAYRVLSKFYRLSSANCAVGALTHHDVFFGVPHALLLRLCHGGDKEQRSHTADEHHEAVSLRMRRSLMQI